jgi:hypothetical protein
VLLLAVLQSRLNAVEKIQWREKMIDKSLIIDRRTFRAGTFATDAVWRVATELIINLVVG